MEAKVGLLAKVVKQQRGERPATAGTVLTAEMTAAAGTIGTSWVSTAVGWIRGKGALEHRTLDPDIPQAMGLARGAV
jgi:hypothetical protein